MLPPSEMEEMKAARWVGLILRSQEACVGVGRAKVDNSYKESWRETEGTEVANSSRGLNSARSHG
jgi:hypothetical protein